MEVSPMEIKEFQTKIFTWYKTNKRNLPWRETTNPYRIHISEIMLAQTQVERVKNYYKTFLKEFPTLESLAKTDKKTLLKLWQGLGYNNRVLRLQQTAKEILEKYEGNYPQENLETLPGIGPYTKGAILAFAFNKDVVVIDTNIRRILIHEFKLEESISQKELESLALKVLPKGQAKKWYNALMDYGAIELTAKKSGIKSLGKQGKFVGSTRWVRSHILKKLLKEHKLIISDLKEEFKDFNIEEILIKMEKDTLLEIQNDKVLLAN